MQCVGEKKKKTKKHNGSRNHKCHEGTEASVIIKIVFLECSIEESKQRDLYDAWATICSQHEPSQCSLTKPTAFYSIRALLCEDIRDV